MISKHVDFSPRLKISDFSKESAGSNRHNLTLTSETQILSVKLQLSLCE